MGKRDRERIARIEAGEEQTIRNEKREKAEARIAEKVSNKMDKKLTKKFGKMDLVQQVKQARKLIKTVGITKFRAGLLEPGGFPKDIQEKRDNGMSSEEILDFYWSCEEFVVFWKEIALNKAHLEELANKQ